MNRGRILLLLVSMVLVSACAELRTPGTGTTPEDITTTIATTTTSTSVPEHETVEVYLSQFSSIEPGWAELFFPYGEELEFLGLMAEGGSVSGPDFGVQTADGRWWFLDTAKRRVARFSEQGVYLDEILIPEALLGNGSTLDHRLPQALDTGSLIATVSREGFTSVLTVTEDNVLESRVGVNAVWDTTDGTFIFGRSTTDGSMLRLVPWENSFTPFQWVTTRDGSRYRATIEGDQLHVELPDAGISRTLRMRLSEQPEVGVNFEVQIESGEDGTLFVLVAGNPLTEPDLGIGGLLTIDSDGTVGRVQSIPDIFAPPDPGSPGHLGVRPATSTPWLMVIGDTGVHIYVRQN